MPDRFQREKCPTCGRPLPRAKNPLKCWRCGEPIPPQDPHYMRHWLCERCTLASNRENGMRKRKPEVAALDRKVWELGQSGMTFPEIARQLSLVSAKRAQDRYHRHEYRMRTDAQKGPHA